MDRHFYVRTVSTKSREFIVRADTQEEAKRLANELLQENAPVMKEGQTIEAIRDDSDANMSVSEVGERLFSDNARVSLPDFLSPLWEKEK